MTASGIRVIMPNIKGVGAIRQRYPIAPVHAHGSTPYKNYDALKDIVLHPKQYPFIIYGNEGSADKEFKFQMQWSWNNKVSRHRHDFILTEKEINKLRSDPSATISVDTDQAEGHTHTLIVKWNVDYNTLWFLKCDGDSQCWDKHPKLCINEGLD